MAKRHIISAYGPDMVQQKTAPGFGRVQPKPKAKPLPKGKGRAKTFIQAAKKAAPKGVSGGRGR